MNAFSSNRIVIDWDEEDAVGPRCPISYLFPLPPTAFMLEVVGPYFRERERVRRILVDNVIQQFVATAGRTTIVHQFDGGEHPRLLASKITTTEREEP